MRKFKIFHFKIQNAYIFMEKDEEILHEDNDRLRNGRKI
jgi:hypothetical protein